MINILKSEFYKIKHTWIPWVHFLLPIIYATLFYLAANFTTLKNYGSNDIIQTYLITLGAVLPIVVGAITSKVIDMEMSAGHFQMLLSSTKSKIKAYIGKLFVLLINAICFIALAITSFDLLFGYQSLLKCSVEVLLVFVGNLSIYTIHLWISIAFGGGASIGLGFLETMLSLLLMTSLGDKIWYYFPSAWSSRLSATYIIGSSFKESSYLYSEFIKWSYIAIPLMIIIMAYSLIWFNFWEGKSKAD